MNPYNVFISHAWKYDDHYTSVVDMLNRANYFSWKNFSAPRSKPLVDPSNRVNKSILIKELEDQIRPVHCVVIIGGMYAAHSEWIDEEIRIAKSMNKPIVMLKPWGQQRLPQNVVYASTLEAGWNAQSLADNIKAIAK